MEIVSRKMTEILNGLIDPDYIENSGIGIYNYCVSHLKIDLLIMLINQLYQRITVLWRIVESFIVKLQEKR